VRLRLLLPRRGRGRGLRALAASAAVATAAGCGGASTATPPLALGVTEGNPYLVAPGPGPARFAPWRDALAVLRPRYLRLLVVWSTIQPRAGRPPDWSAPADGCLRGAPPCAPFNGVRDELLAARSAGLQVVVTILGTPDWAAARPQGCERPGTLPSSRAPGDLAAYRALIRSLLAEGRRTGADLRWWSAWNEPNHPAFLNPQHATCSPASTPVAAHLYAELVRALRAELAAAPGEHHVVLGETAALGDSTATTTSAADFVRALPRDVVCDAGVWAQHAYVDVHDPLAGDEGPDGAVHAVEAALADRRCPGGPPHLWITETGVAAGSGAGGCRALSAALRAWAADPRVDAAFQYTFREDDAFQVGLADAGLTHLRPAYAAWRAAADGSLDGSACDQS